VATRMFSLSVNPMSLSVEPARIFGLPKLPVTLPVVLSLGLILERFDIEFAFE